MLNLIIIYSFSKIGNGQVVGNHFLEKVICNLLKSHNFLKFVSWKLILSLPKQPFNNNIAILESKIIYFCLRSNFRESTTLNEVQKSRKKNLWWLCDLWNTIQYYWIKKKVKRLLLCHQTFIAISIFLPTFLLFPCQIQGASYPSHVKVDDF